MIEVDVISRIKDSYDTFTQQEQYYLRKILQEFADSGTSETYDKIWLADYKEIPVSLNTFLDSNMYLGKATRQGTAIYPYWRDTLNEIFGAGNSFDEVVFTGATRIGKTSTAITGAAYMLYRMMCLRDPQKFFGKKEISKFSVLFFNLTLDLAKGVAFREYNDTLKVSEWFNQHGSFSKSDRNFYYIPEGDKVIVDFGSDAAHALGQQVFVALCVVGNTPVLTSQGYLPISEITDKTVQIGQYDSNSVVYAPGSAQITGYVQDTIRVELEDGTIIEGTPDHRVMLSDGTYKCLGELTSSDDVLTFNIDEVDHMNLKNDCKEFVVYIHTSPSNKSYVGITSQSVVQRWGCDGQGYKDNAHFWAAIQKYGWDNFTHEILYENLTLEQACEIECKLIADMDLMNPEFGYNHTSGGQYSTPSDEIRTKLRESTSKLWLDPEFRSKVVNSLTGRTLSTDTKRKISDSKIGKKYSKPSPLRGRKLSEARIAKMRGQTPWNRGLTKYTDHRVAEIASKIKGRVKSPEECANISEGQKLAYINGYAPIWVNDGNVEIQIDSSKDAIPENFTRGRLQRDQIYMHRGQESKKVNRDEIDDYLQAGWSRGRGSAVGRAISKGRIKYRWKYEDKLYDNSADLAKFLRENGYPEIVDSTITSLYHKGFENSKKYSSLAGKIEKVPV